MFINRLLGQRGQNSISILKMNSVSKQILCLFDVDGTITPPRQKITKSMDDFLQRLRSHCKVGLVGGSDISKIAEQIGGMDCISKYDYVFSENGLVSYKRGELYHTQSIATHFSEDVLQEFINGCLRKLSEIQLPFKRGTFIEFRKGLINVSPVGRNCTQSERDYFEKYDKEHEIRKKLIDSLSKDFPNLAVTYSIGGQISFDVFPVGWDKTYALKLINDEDIDVVYFFGDKVLPGGNDYEIYNDPRTIGTEVLNPEDTMEKVKKYFPL